MKSDTLSTCRFTCRAARSRSADVCALSDPGRRQSPAGDLIHGCCLTGKTWETTPDGRMGWDEYSVRQGSDLRDRPGGARALGDRSVDLQQHCSAMTRLTRCRRSFRRPRAGLGDLPLRPEYQRWIEGISFRSRLRASSGSRWSPTGTPPSCRPIRPCAGRLSELAIKRRGHDPDQPFAIRHLSLSDGGHQHPRHRGNRVDRARRVVPPPPAISRPT